MSSLINDLAVLSSLFPIGTDFFFERSQSDFSVCQYKSQLSVMNRNFPHNIIFQDENTLFGRNLEMKTFMQDQIFS